MHSIFIPIYLSLLLVLYLATYGSILEVERTSVALHADDVR